MEVKKTKLEEDFGEAKEFINKTFEAIKHFVAEALKMIRRVYNDILTHCAKRVNSKWHHYWRNSKKKRIRRKYERKILREIGIAVKRGR